MMYKDKKILITGGTGTIGYHLTKRLLEENPKVIRIYSRDEYKQYQMNIDFQGQQDKLRFLIGDVRDEQRLLRAMEDIDYVFHLAAMKHVPACEYNPFEAVKTNVLGTQNVIQSAISAGVSKVLFTSSDKAISPTNTYGATKLTAERLISAAEYQKGPKQTIFSSVRFGNVMGSRGSVIPLFKKQIIEEGRVTITDPEMLRYMMTPEEAISLMLKANQLACGGEVFVLKMPVIRIADLVEVIDEELNSSESNRAALKKEIIGLRSGEKLVEELMTREEWENALEIDGMYIIPSAFKEKKYNYNVVKKAINMPMSDLVINKEILREWVRVQQLI